MKNTNKMADLVIHTLGHKGFDYDRLEEGLFLGTNMCCQYGFNAELLEKGVRADISLEADRSDAPKGVDFYLWLPTEDGEAPSQDQLTLGVDTLTFLHKRGVKTFLHCKNGHGRAPTLYIAYLIHQGMTVAEAMRILQERRPTAHPTEKQMEALKKFAG